MSRTTVIGEFEWDSAKARANLLKHGVSFEEAMECFLDPRGIVAPEFAHPQRFVLIGMSQSGRVLFVVSVEVGERVRIVSARKAAPAQRKIYQHGPKD